MEKVSYLILVLAVMNCVIISMAAPVNLNPLTDTRKSLDLKQLFLTLEESVSNNRLDSDLPHLRERRSTDSSEDNELDEDVFYAPQQQRQDLNFPPRQGIIIMGNPAGLLSRLTPQQRQDLNSPPRQDINPSHTRKRRSTDSSEDNELDEDVFYASQQRQDLNFPPRQGIIIMGNPDGFLPLPRPTPRLNFPRLNFPPRQDSNPRIIIWGNPDT